jgi:hypothetical protein
MLIICVSCQKPSSENSSRSNDHEQQSPASPQPSGDNDEGPFPILGVPYTHEEMQHYRRLKQQIWKSSLGHLFREYVSEQETTAQVLNLSSVITERVFSVAGEETIRIAAVQIMVEDLYAMGKINSEVSHRLRVLDGNINQRQIILNTVPVEKLLSDTPYFFLIGFLAGSRELGIQSRNLLEALRASAARVWSTKRLREFLPVESEGLDWRRVVGPAFFEGYRPMHAVHGFVNVFGPYSFAYIYLFRQRRVMGKEAGVGRVLISGIEELVDIGDL